MVTLIIFSSKNAGLVLHLWEKQTEILKMDLKFSFFLGKEGARSTCFTTHKILAENHCKHYNNFIKFKYCLPGKEQDVFLVAMGVQLFFCCVGDYG